MLDILQLTCPLVFSVQHLGMLVCTHPTLRTFLDTGAGQPCWIGPAKAICGQDYKWPDAKYTAKMILCLWTSTPQYIAVEPFRTMKAMTLHYSADWMQVSSDGMIIISGSMERIASNNFACSLRAPVLDSLVSPEWTYAPGSIMQECTNLTLL